MLWQVDVKRATPKADGMGGMRGGRGGRGGRGRGRGGECNLYISYGWSLFIGCLQWRISTKQFIKEVKIQTQNAHSLHWYIQIKRLLKKTRLCSMRMLVSNSNHIKNYWSQFNLRQLRETFTKVNNKQNIALTANSGWTHFSYNDPLALLYVHSQELQVRTSVIRTTVKKVPIIVFID